MTVSFTPKTIVIGDVASNPFATFFKEPIKATPEFWWITRVYITQSVEQPIKWEPYDHSTYTNVPGLEEGFLEWVSYMSKADASGWKIVTMRLDMHNGQAALETSYCKEYFKPKEKIYINGPKKKPFPKAASKHY